MTQRPNALKNKNLVNYNTSKFTLGPISNSAIIFVLIALIGLIYLTQITKTSQYSYQLNTLEQEYSDKLKENQSLEIEAARLQSVNRLDDVNTSSYKDADASSIDYSKSLKN